MRPRLKIIKKSLVERYQSDNSEGEDPDLLKDAEKMDPQPREMVSIPFPMNLRPFTLLPSACIQPRLESDFGEVSAPIQTIITVSVFHGSLLSSVTTRLEAFCFFVLSSF